MDPRTLAEYIAGQLDGEQGPDDEGFIAAMVTDDGAIEVMYDDDEFGLTSTYRLTVEQIS